MAESKGQWLDTSTGKVVTSPPEEGVQLQAPGTEETDLGKVLAKQASDPDAAPETVTSKSARPKS